MSRPIRAKKKRAQHLDDHPQLPLSDGKVRTIRARTAAPSVDSFQLPELSAADVDGSAPDDVVQPRPRSQFERSLKRSLDKAWNLLIGLALIPFCWIFTDAIFNAFGHVPHRGRIPFWKVHEFLVFAGGGALWMAWFSFCIWRWRHPRPLTLYVWGHELMHVLAARLCGGRIKGYEITREGGYVVTDRYNFLIALAPYLWPFASVPVLAAWGIIGWTPLASECREYFLLALGFTWMAHISFTAWMIPIGQSDFEGPGSTFSLSLIYLANVVLLSACLICLPSEISFGTYWRELSASTIGFYQAVLEWFGRVFTNA